MNRTIYRLQNKSLPEAATIVFPKTLKSTAGFVMSSALTGVVYGQVHSMAVEATNIIKTGTLYAALLVGVFSTVYFAKKTYENWRQEKKRLMSLSNTYEREKTLHIEQDRLERLKRDSEILDAAGFVEHPELLEGLDSRTR